MLDKIKCYLYLWSSEQQNYYSLQKTAAKWLSYVTAVTVRGGGGGITKC